MTAGIRREDDRAMVRRRVPQMRDADPYKGEAGMEHYLDLARKAGPPV